MARPLRVEFAGACCHVINRGNFRFPVFGEDRDRELILARLVDFAAETGDVDGLTCSRAVGSDVHSPLITALERNRPCSAICSEVP